MRNLGLRYRMVIIVASLLLLSSPWMASAYVGPGPGLSFLTSFLGLLLAIFAALFLVVILPILKLLRQKKAN